MSWICVPKKDTKVHLEESLFSSLIYVFIDMKVPVLSQAKSQECIRSLQPQFCTAELASDIWCADILVTVDEAPADKQNVVNFLIMGLR
jgi:hypothetical protein